VEAFALRKLRDGAGIRIAAADFHESLQMVAHEVKIDIGPGGGQTLFVNVDVCSEESPAKTEQNNAGVEELLAINPGYDTKHGVIK
jgi:hypothetical protein